MPIEHVVCLRQATKRFIACLSLGIFNVIFKIYNNTGSGQNVTVANTAKAMLNYCNAIICVTFCESDEGDRVFIIYF